jgi:hypothetical protein
MVDAQMLDLDYFKSGGGGAKAPLMLRHASDLARPTPATDIRIHKYSLHTVPLNLTI